MCVMKKNDVLKVDIEGYSSEGHGVAKPDGFVLFVPGALIGETAVVHVLKVNKHFGYAKIVGLVTASPYRVTPLCTVCDKCGGCAMWHTDYEEEKRFKYNKVLQNLKKAGIDAHPDSVVSCGEVTGYRNKAQYPVREQNGSIAVGFYRNGSHTVIEGECRIQPRVFDAVAGFIKSLMPRYGISAYNEITHKGTLRHIYLRSNADKSQIMLCLVVNGAFDKSHPVFDDIAKEFPQVTTVCINYNNENTNVILGEKFETVYGKGYISDTLLGKSFNISPQSFYQVNHDCCEKLYSLAAEHIRGSERVLDLYCGIGTVGICTAGEGALLTGVEIVPEAVENAKHNAILNGIENARFYAADAGNVAKVASGDFDAIIVDPPRKGCDIKTLEFIIEKRPEKLVYISCDSATLARDLKILTEYFDIEKITPVDMFPRTHHCEVFCAMRLKQVKNNGTTDDK